MKVYEVIQGVAWLEKGRDIVLLATRGEVLPDTADFPVNGPRDAFVVKARPGSDDDLERISRAMLERIVMMLRLPIRDRMLVTLHHLARGCHLDRQGFAALPEITLRDIARYVGTERTLLTAMLSKLRADGTVQRVGNRQIKYRESQILRKRA